MKTVFALAGIIIVVMLAVNLGTALQDRALQVDLKSVELELTRSQAELNSAQARKANAEAHRIEDELKRDKYGWTAVTMEESGIGNLIGVTILLGSFGLLVVIGGFFILRPSWMKG